MTGRIRRVGNVRLPDDQRSTWNVASPNSINPGDILSGAPSYGGQPIRELAPIIVTEEHMVAVEPPKASVRGRKPKVKAVLPPDANMSLTLSGKGTPARTAINLRIPAGLLRHYKADGPKYQSRIIAVLEMFVREGGTFTEE
jgi:uncharacterized protein (DUF4415 family)